MAKDDASSLDQLREALTSLQQQAADPNLRAIFRSLVDQFCPPPPPTSALIEAARRGKPSSSRPGSTAKATPVEKTEVKDDVKSEGEEDKGNEEIEEINTKDLENASTTGENPTELVINSSTHRKEHARLSRRMGAADAAATCPEMMKLWNGSRKDWISGNKKCFKIGSKVQ